MSDPEEQRSSDVMRELTAEQIERKRDGKGVSGALFTPKIATTYTGLWTKWETRKSVHWRPIGDHFWGEMETILKTIIELSVVSSNIGSNNFGLTKMALFFWKVSSSLIFMLKG